MTDLEGHEEEKLGRKGRYNLNERDSQKFPTLSPALRSYSIPLAVLWIALWVIALLSEGDDRQRLLLASDIMLAAIFVVFPLEKIIQLLEKERGEVG